MNYGDLQTAIQNGLDRTDIATEVADFIDRARERINSELRGPGNIKLAELTASSGVITKPADFVAVASIADADDNELRPATLTEFRQYLGGSGKGRVYVVDQAIRLAPQDSTSYTVTYWYSQSAFATSSDTVPEPELYLYAGLREGAVYLQNFDLATRYEELYQLKLKSRNREWRWRQPVTMGTSEYDYTRSGGAL